MRVLRSLVVSLSLFSRIPLPKLSWDDSSLRWVMAWFPLVGVLVGGVLLLWNYLAGLLDLGPFLFGVGFALVPVLVTGAIHMDGFCDTVDALASNTDEETRQRILKDPTTGAFAVVMTAVYLLAYAALASELYARDWMLVACFCCVFVLSRCLAGLCIVWFKPARSSGLAHTFADNTSKRATGVILAIGALLSAVGMLVLAGIPAAAALLGALLAFGLLRFWLLRQFGGLSGDLVGWFIQICELGTLIGLVFADKILMLLVV